MNPTVSREQHRPPVGQLPTPRARVERGEQLVGRQFLSPGQLIEQRALAGVGVADERDRHSVGPRGNFALFATEHFVEVGLQLDDPPLDEPAVGFELLLARPAHAHAGLDPRQVGPHPFEPRQRVFELGEFDRQPGFVRLGSRRENIEDHLGAIEHLDVERHLEIANLRRREIVVEDDHAGIGGPHHSLELLELTLAEISGYVGRVAALGESTHDLRPGGFGEAGQLLERLVVVRPVRQKDADQNGRLALDA